MEQRSSLETSYVTMGISGSRGKKVAPASVTEGDSSTQTLNCQASSASWKNTQEEHHRNRQFSVDDRNLAEEVEQIFETSQNTEGTKRGFLGSPLYMFKNYNFCYNQRDQHDTDTESTYSANILSSDVLKHGGFEDKKEICTFRNLSKPQKQTAVTADPVCTMTTHVPGFCEDILLVLPVSYDALEEDLMNAIEREFG